MCLPFIAILPFIVVVLSKTDVERLSFCEVDFNVLPLEVVHV